MDYAIVHFLHSSIAHSITSFLFKKNGMLVFIIALCIDDISADLASY